MKKIIGGVMALACVLSASAMESFRDSKGQYQPFRFKIEQGHEGIIFDDAPGSFLVQNFKSFLKERGEKIISLEAQNGQEIKGLTEELERLPESPKRFSFELYLSVLKEEGQELEKRRKAIGTYERLFLKILRAIYQSEGKEVFCFAAPNFNALNNKKLQDISLSSLLVMAGDHEVIGESYINLEIKGLSSELFHQLNSFFQCEVMMRARELYDLKKELTEKSKELYEVHKTYSTFSPFFVSATQRLEPRIKKVIDEAGGIIEQLEPAWRMTEAILAFQNEVFAHIQGAAQREMLDSLKGDYPFERKKEDNGHDEQSPKNEKLKEGELEKKEELEDDPFLLIPRGDRDPELSPKKSMLEGGVGLSEWWPSVLRRGEGSQGKEGQESQQSSPMLTTPSTPVQGRWGGVSFLGGYSPFRTPQQQGEQRDVSPEPERNDRTSRHLNAIAKMLNDEAFKGKL